MTEGIYFAPLEGITNLHLRKAFEASFGGVSRFYAPFFTPQPKVILRAKEERDLTPLTVPVVPQVLTNRADMVIASMEAVIEKFGSRELNLNLGCPSGTVTAKGKGSGFLRDPEALDRFFDEVFTLMEKSGLAEKISLTVKTRLGVDEPDEWPEILKVYNRYPIAELTVHPRVKKEMYRGDVHRDWFDYTVEHTDFPLIYNGDLLTAEDIAAVREAYPGVGIMVGRGLLRNPFLAEEAEGKVTAGEERTRRLKHFHDALYESYYGQFGEDPHIVGRMKEYWALLGDSFPDQSKEVKEIMKSRNPAAYRAAVRVLFG